MDTQTFVDFRTLIAAGEFNAWRQDHPTVTPDLSGLDLGGLVLESTDFSSCNLQGVKFVRAYLGRCNCTAADLTGADFEGASLVDRCSLADAVLDQTHLQGTCFSECDLRGATFHGADLRGSSFVGCNCTDLQLDPEADLSLTDFSDCTPDGFGED